MLTAHLPAGYVLARLARRPETGVMAAALAGSMVPDLDMLWFHFVDNGSIHHHRYWPHIPLIWAGIAVVVMATLWRSRWRGAGLMFFASILLHLVLDSIAGGILWLYPFDDRLWQVIEVPAAYGHWIISFVLHWTFLLEVAVWVWAIWLAFRDRVGRPA